MGDIFKLFDKIGLSQTKKTGSPEYLIAGLGNPGAKYDLTRHNAGFMAIDHIAERCGAPIKNSKFKALTSVTEISDRRVLLMKPQTFMNLSGESIGEASSYYGIPPEHVIVLSDDICQAPGRIRIRRSGSAGGHNGLANIILHLAGDGFPRIRIGVGEKPTKEYDLVSWVLGRMSEKELDAMSARFDDVFDAAGLIISGRIDDAMGKFNGKQ